MADTVLIPGRFLPLHKGHLSLIDTARTFGKPLPMILGPSPDWAARTGWLAHHCPDTPPLEAPDIPDITHTQTIAQAAAGHDVTRVIGSHPAVVQIADHLNCAHTVLDPDRFALPIAAAAIRANPAAHWQDLAPAAAMSLQKHLILVGPESSGKSTLARKLVDKYGGPLVPEYGRPFEEYRPKGDYRAEELIEIARTHTAHRAALAQYAGPVLIEDTDPLLTAVWAEMLLGHPLPEVEDLIELPDLYALLHWDVPWADDPLRYFATPEDRRRFFNLIEAKLIAYGAHYRVLDGNYEAREAQADALYHALIPDLRIP